jgi:hypothetical protein
MIGKVNDVLSTFGELHCTAKLDLVYKYCYSLYGSVCWNLRNPDILSSYLLCIAYCSHTVLGLAYKTHIKFVIALSSKVSLLNELHLCGWLSFILSVWIARMTLLNLDVQIRHLSYEHCLDTGVTCYVPVTSTALLFALSNVWTEWTT